MKHAQVFGHHIKFQDVEFESFDQLTKGSLPKLFKKYNGWKENSEDIAIYYWGQEYSFNKNDIIKAPFNQFCSLISKAGAKFTLQNNEVLFQWPTQSIVGYKFDSKKDALDFFNWLTENKFNVKFSQNPFKYDIGDKVLINTEVIFELFPLLDQIAGFDKFSVKAGDTVEIFDINDKTFIIKPIIGKHFLEHGPANWHGIITLTDTLAELPLEIIDCKVA